ncbi:MAG: amidohydrolase family protein [Chloroflexi bacterium]|nr:amidohydrolase family protein [Chloroflexota bacterium]
MKILTGATLIDGAGGPVTPDSTVVIDGERIIEVGPRRSIEYPPDADILDISGMTLLPGLIDCHDHLSGLGYHLVNRWELDAPPSLRHLRIAKVLKETLDTGYTAVRDGGGLDRGFKMAVEDGLIPGPRLVLGINIISPTGGIADGVSPSGHRRPEPANVSLPSGVADGVEAVRAKVREMVRMGADVVKFATTGGASSRPGHGPKDIEFGREEIQALVDEAHALGRKAMCHAIGGAGLRLAIEAGVDSIEHGSYLDEDPGLIPMMAQKGIFYVPTLTVYVFHREAEVARFRSRAQAMYSHHTDSIQKALAAGVKVVAGTDAGGYAHFINAQELQWLVEQGGMTPAQALVSATGWAAECLGLEKEIGTIEKGKLADLVVVDGDPIRDIKVLQDTARIKMVLKGGQVHIDSRVGSRI